MSNAKKGDRIKLISMAKSQDGRADPSEIPAGTEGTVEYIDDIQAIVKWDNGSTLNLALPEDKYIVVLRRSK